jgi:hypothetical protein
VPDVENVIDITLLSLDSELVGGEEDNEVTVLENKLPEVVPVGKIDDSELLNDSALLIADATLETVLKLCAEELDKVDPIVSKVLGFEDSDALKLFVTVLERVSKVLIDDDISVTEDWLEAAVDVPLIICDPVAVMEAELVAEDTVL